MNKTQNKNRISLEKKTIVKTGQKAEPSVQNILSQRAVFVLGMHRSGTSTLARALLSLGIDWGNNLLGADTYNSKGYLEDIDIWRINRQILTSATSDPDYAMSMAGRVDFDSFIDGTISSNINKVISKKCIDSPFWGCKDPRLSLTFPLWENYLLKQRVKTSTVVALRNPLEVASSINSRDGFSLSHGLLLWYTFNYSILQIAAKTPTIIVKYDNLLEDPVGTIERVAKGLSINSSSYEKDIHKYAKTFLDKGLRHHKKTTAALENACSDFPEIPILYKKLKTLAASPTIALDNARRTLAEIPGFGLFHKYFRSIPTKEYHYISETLSRKNLKLYLGFGDGFSEKHSLTQEYNYSTGSVSFELTGTDKLRALRLDPCDSPCILDFTQARIKYQDERSTEIKPASSNAFLNEDGKYIFTTSDPQLFFDIDSTITSAIFELNFTQATEPASKAIIGTQEQRVYTLIATAEQVKLETEQAHIKAEQAKLETEQAHIKAEQAKLETEQAHIKAEQAYIKADQANLEADRWQKELLKTLQKVQLEKDKNQALTACIAQEQWEKLELVSELKIVKIGLFSAVFFKVIKWNGRMLSTMYEGYKIKKSRLFDSEYYVKCHPDIRDSVQNPLRHFIQHGWKEGRNPSPYFDTKYYLRTNKDVAESGTNPFLHYIQLGWSEGRNPSPYFDTKYYLRTNKDVAESGTNPLLHYIQLGWTEGRNPSPYFDIKYHLKTVPNLMELNRDPLLYYIEHGWRDGHSPSPYFDQSYYRRNYANILGVEADPFLHYLESGWAERKNPSPYFNSQYYIDNNSDICTPQEDPLLNYINHGWQQGRNPSVYFDIKYYQQMYLREVEHERDPLLHYIEVGWREGKNPSPYFDVQYYLWNDPAFFKSGKEPLSHYLQFGWCEGKQPSMFFDTKYYLNQNADIETSGQEPLSHYIQNGWQDARNPSALFDINYYLSNNPEVAKTNKDPLLHYINIGLSEGRKANEFELRLSDDKDIYEKKKIRPSSLFVKIIAFYLPQFHPIPENNEWWGDGFTEWINVSKARPLFDGHHQPQLPDTMGFYDLRMPEVMKKQAELAKEFGIHGFCFHHYYFSGKRLLEKPVDNFLEHPEIEIQFCLCWANENWTRRWDGLEHEVLIGQKHSPQDDIRFLDDVDRYFQDSRYITIDNKPILIIYRPSLFPDMKATIKRWREYRRNNQQSDLYLVMVLGFGDVDPDKYGFDAGVEFPPHSALSPVDQSQFSSPIVDLKSLGNNINSVDNFAGEIRDYSTFVEGYPVREANFTMFKTAFPSWDNTARRGNNSHLFINATPENYYAWILRNIKYSYDLLPKSSCFTFINAWNEWAEGAHLEPDRTYGYAYLNATSNALATAEAWAKKHPSLVNNFREDAACLSNRILVVIHLYYVDLAEEIVGYLNNIPCDFDICISTVPAHVETIDNTFRKAFPEAKVIVKGAVNQGYDIAPFLIEFGKIIKQYPLVCKIHGKKSTHSDGLDAWRHHLYENLLGTPYRIFDILNTFFSNEKIGIIYPKHFEAISDWVQWGLNYDIASELFKRMHIKSLLPKTIEFPSGSMFWFRPEAMLKLFECNLNYNDFLPPQDTLPDFTDKVSDGTLAHAIERIFVELVRTKGFNAKVVDYSSARYVQTENEVWQIAPCAKK